MLKKLATVCALVLLTGCPDYDEDVEPPPEPPPDGGVRPPPPIPPPQCPRGLCGETCCPKFPGSYEGFDEGTGMLVLVRVDRSLANLAPGYAKLIPAAGAAMKAAGFDLRTTAVGSLHDGTLIWGSGFGVETDRLEDTLKAAAAASEPGMPVNCTTSGLASLARTLKTAEVEGSGWRPFEPGLAVLLVMVLDHGDRPLTAYSEGCRIDGVRPFDHFSSPTTSAWTDALAEPRLNTRFVLIHTDEEVSFEEYRGRCQGIAGFPKEALDSVEPSELSFFKGFTPGMNTVQPTLAQSTDLCAAVASFDATGPFAKTWANELIAANPSPPEPPPEPAPTTP